MAVGDRDRRLSAIFMADVVTARGKYFYRELYGNGGETVNGVSAGENNYAKGAYKTDLPEWILSRRRGYGVGVTQPAYDQNRPQHVHEQSRTALNFGQSHKQQGERNVFRKVAMNPHGPG